jgi:hypothetical protein
MPERKSDIDYFNAEQFYARLRNDDYRNSYNKGINKIIIQQNMDRAMALPQPAMAGRNASNTDMFPDMPFLPGELDNNQVSKAVVGSVVPGSGATGGKKQINRTKHAKKWLDFSKSAVNDALDIKDRATGSGATGGKKQINRTKHASKWLDFSKDVVNDGLDIKDRAVGRGGAGKPKLAWIPYVKKYALEHKVSYKEALSKASSGFRSQK